MGLSQWQTGTLTVEILALSLILLNTLSLQALAQFSR